MLEIPSGEVGDASVTNEVPIPHTDTISNSRCHYSSIVLYTRIFVQARVSFMQ